MCVVSGFTAGTKALINPVTAIMMVAIAPIEAEVRTADAKMISVGLYPVCIQAEGFSSGAE